MSSRDCAIHKKIQYQGFDCSRPVAHNKLLNEDNLRRGNELILQACVIIMCRRFEVFTWQKNKVTEPNWTLPFFFSKVTGITKLFQIFVDRWNQYFFHLHTHNELIKMQWISVL